MAQPPAPVEHGALAELHMAAGVDAERAEIERKLKRSLGPEFIKERAGPGGSKIAYIEGWQAINLANDVFGALGWSSEVREQGIDTEHYNEKLDRWSISSYAVVRITLRDGSFREDVGAGSAENIKSKAEALTKVRKEAVTDALKRAMRQFGEVLGNCVYNPKYRDFIKRMKAPEPKFDARELHRASHGRAAPPAAPAVTAAPEPVEKLQKSLAPVAQSHNGQPPQPAVQRAPPPQRNATMPSRLALPPPAPAPAPAGATLKPQCKPDPSVRPTTTDMLGDMDDSIFDEAAYNLAVEGDSGFCGQLLDEESAAELGGKPASDPPVARQPEQISTSPPAALLLLLHQKKEEALRKLQNRQEELRRSKEAALKAAVALNIPINATGPHGQFGKTNVPPPQRAHTTGSLTSKGVAGHQQSLKRPAPESSNDSPRFMSANGVKRTMLENDAMPQPMLQSLANPHYDTSKRFHT
ncbi:DNA repair protein rad52 [Microbotryomycetes sp. JL201]|nr:DNA repair protein rad52 [Microbotryomycetes sp. JL201]